MPTDSSVSAQANFVFPSKKYEFGRWCYDSTDTDPYCKLADTAIHSAFFGVRQDWGWVMTTATKLMLENGEPNQAWNSSLPTG